MYISPFEIIGSNPSGKVPGRAEIRKGKKRLLAELSLEGDRFQYRQHNLNRSDVLFALDELDQEVKFLGHWKVFQHRELLAFLSGGTLPTPGAFDALKNDTAFIDFITPTFIQQYQSLLLRFYQLREKEQLQQLLQLPVLAAEYSKEAVYNKLKKELDRRLEQLEWLEEQYGIADLDVRGTVKVKRLQQLFDVDCLNLLPIDFQPYRNRLSIAISNIGFQMNNGPSDFISGARLCWHYQLLKQDKGESTYAKEVRKALFFNILIYPVGIIRFLLQFFVMTDDVIPQKSHVHQGDCWFCDTEQPAVDAYSISLVKWSDHAEGQNFDLDMQGLLWGYRKENVLVAYCQNCQNIWGNEYENYGLVYRLSFTALVLYIGYSTFDVPVQGGIWGAIFGFTIGQILFMCHRNKLWEKKGIKHHRALRTICQHHPLIKEKRAGGWRLAHWLWPEEE